MNKHIRHDGKAIIDRLEALKHSDSPRDQSALSEKIIEHASRLTSYQDKRLKTTEPEPSEIIRLIRAGEYDELSVRLFTD